jgi:hypothetical protein
VRGSVSLLFLCLVACSASDDRALLTDDEREQGFRLLFDGVDLEGWRAFGQPGLPAGWEAVDGTIHFIAPTEGSRSDLITVDKFANFELAMQWAISTAGNSGILFRVSEDGDQSFHTGPEMQVLDDEGVADVTPETSASSNYALHAPSVYQARAAGEFNDIRLVVYDNTVQHWMNGTKVVEYCLGSQDWLDRVAASKFAAWPDYGLNSSGHLALQDHGDEVWFRRIRVRELSSPPEDSGCTQ